jgi:hypothetical protein
MTLQSSARDDGAFQRHEGFACQTGRLREWALNCLDGRDKPVTALSQCFNKCGILGVVTQSFAQLVYGNAQAVVEVDGRIRAPEPLLQRFAGDHFARMLQKRRQHLEGLALQMDPHPGTAQFSALQVNVKETELHSCPSLPRFSSAAIHAAEHISGT